MELWSFQSVIDKTEQKKLSFNKNKHLLNQRMISIIFDRIIKERNIWNFPVIFLIVIIISKLMKLNLFHFIFINNRRDTELQRSFSL